MEDKDEEPLNKFRTASEEESTDNEWAAGSESEPEVVEPKLKHRKNSKASKKRESLDGWWPQHEVIQQIGKREFLMAMRSREFETRPDVYAGLLYRRKLRNPPATNKKKETWTKEMEPALLPETEP